MTLPFCVFEMLAWYVKSLQSFTFSVCQADLINRMAKKGIPVPDNIFEETRSEGQPTIEQVTMGVRHTKPH